MERLWADWTDYSVDWNASGLYADDMTSVFQPGAAGAAVHAQLRRLQRQNEDEGVKWTDVDCTATDEIDSVTGGEIVQCTAIEHDGAGNSAPIEGTYAVVDGQNVRILGFRRT